MTTQAELDLAFLEVANQILANRKPSSASLVDAASISLTTIPHRSVQRVTIAGNRTIANPTGTYLHGHTFILEVTQDGTGSRTLAFGNKFRFSQSITLPTLSTAAGKLDRLAFQYHVTDDKWDLIAFAKGF